MNDKKITYFYQAGRKDKLFGKEEYAKEMFYGYHYFQKKFNSVNIVEFLPIESKIRRLFRTVRRGIT